MAVTIVDNFRGQKNKALDDRVIQNTREEALVVLRQRGANGLPVTVLYKEETAEDGTITQIFDPVLYIAFYNTEIADWDLQETGSGEYTNTEPSVIAVGGIKKGTIFEDKSVAEMFDMMLYPELFPTLTGPSLTIQASPNLIEVGAVQDVQLVATFNRGRINPAYGTNGFRAGPVTGFTFNGTFTNTTNNSFTTTQQITSDLSGERDFRITYSYEEGPQPLSSKGSAFNTPLPAGQLTATTKIDFVLPYFATTNQLAILDKQPLKIYESFIEITVVSEDIASTSKQSISYPAGLGVCTGIQMYNTLNTTWEWLNGAREQSVASFTESSEERVINTVSKLYRTYSHNGAVIGQRSLRFYI